MEIWYTARKRFGLANGPDWEQWVQWTGLAQVMEPVTLDTVLCPEVIQELTAEDWEHNVDEDYVIFYFRDLDYLIARIAPLDQAVNVLAVCREPGSDVSATFADPRFEFQGYELLDRFAGNSALTNCGGFPEAFENADLSSRGLVEDYARARAIQLLLRQEYPQEVHADCNLWAIWKLVQPA